MSIQGWFLLELTGLIPLQSKGLSRVFSSTTVWKYQSFGSQLSLWFNSHICTWLLEKNMALTIWIFAGKVIALLFNMMSKWASLVAQMVKNLLSILETRVPSLGLEDLLEEGMATTLVFLPGESPWTEKPGGLQSMGSQRLGYNWATKHTHSTDLWNRIKNQK